MCVQSYTAGKHSQGPPVLRGWTQQGKLIFAPPRLVVWAPGVQRESRWARELSVWGDSQGSSYRVSAPLHPQPCCVVWAHLPSTLLSVMKPSAVSSYFQGPDVTVYAQEQAACKLMYTRGGQVSEARGGGESMVTMSPQGRAHSLPLTPGRGSQLGLVDTMTT